MFTPEDWRILLFTFYSGTTQAQVTPTRDFGRVPSEKPDIPKIAINEISCCGLGVI
jgi:hypothetical protein